MLMTMLRSSPAWVPRPFAALALLLALAACGEPERWVGVVNTQDPAALVAGTRQHKIYIATMRARSDVPGEFFSGDRAHSVSFASVVV
jgi:esterase/lipase superfamily enzyme